MEDVLDVRILLKQLVRLEYEVGEVHALGLAETILIGLVVHAEGWQVAAVQLLVVRHYGHVLQQRDALRIGLQLLLAFSWEEV